MERSSHRDASPPLMRLDPVSRSALQGFAFQTAILAAVSLAFGGAAPLGMFILLTALAGQCNSFAALFSRQRYARGPLSRWDVGMMHFALSLGARLLQ